MLIFYIASLFFLILANAQQLTQFTNTQSVKSLSYVEIDGVPYIAGLGDTPNDYKIEFMNLNTKAQVTIDVPDINGFGAVNMKSIETPIGYQLLFFDSSNTAKIGSVYMNGGSIEVSPTRSLGSVISYFYQSLSDVIYICDGTNVKGKNLYSLTDTTIAYNPLIFYLTFNRQYYVLQESGNLKVIEVSSNGLKYSISYTDTIVKISEYYENAQLRLAVCDSLKNCYTLKPSGSSLTLSPIQSNSLALDPSYGSRLLQVKDNGLILNLDFTNTSFSQNIYQIAGGIVSAYTIETDKKIVASYNALTTSVVKLSTQCNKKCSKCIIGNTTTCSVCNTYDNREMQSGQCVCKSGYIETDQEVCVKCSDANCLACFDIIQKSCYLCNTGYLVTSTNECGCQVGYYLDSGICKQCPIGCQQCTSPTACTKCSANSNRTLGGGVCTCDSAFFEESQSKSCISCHKSCKKCSGSGQNSCTDCDAATQILNNGYCQCKLINQYFDNTFTCQNCDPTCRSCLGQANFCTTCDPSANRYLSPLNKCECLQGYFDSAGTCTSCNVPFCNTCTVAGTCVTCQILNGFTLTPSGGKCVCPNGYYLDIIQGTCMKCHYSCDTCSGPQKFECNLCSTTFSVKTTDNQCICPTGYYEINQYCAKCNDNCENCSKQSNNCLTCHPGSGTHIAYSSTKQINECVCDDTKYMDTSGVCQACDATILCKTCSSATYCLSCLDNAELSPDKTCKCKQGYQFNVNKCDICTWTPPCSGCQPEKMFRNDTTCVCLEGYYLDGNGLCQKCHQECKQCNGPLLTNCKCHESCQTCVGPNINQCLTCFGNYLTPDGPLNVGYCNKCSTNHYISNGDCLQCDPNCAECLYTSTYCTACKPYQTLLTNKTCGCLPGYIDNGTACAQIVCVSTDLCTLCSSTNPASCIKCDDSAHLTLFEGKCVCSPGYGWDSTTSACVVCHPLCNTCNSSDYKKCTSCNLEQFRVHNIDKCICKDDYTGPDSTDVFSQFICQKCHYSCLSCSGPGAGNCTSCGSNRNPTANCECINNYYDLGNMQSCVQCPSGTYTKSSDQYQYCKPCDVTCKECDGDSIACSKCEIIYNRILDGPSKECKCITGHYNYSSNSAFCKQCPYYCPDCQSTLNLVTHDYDVSCNNCPASSHRTGPQCTCDSGYYNIEGDSICKKCHYSCQTCSGPGIGDCLTCPAGRISKNGSTELLKECICPTQTYDKLGDPTCGACHQSCQECKGGSASDCLVCPDPNDMEIVDGYCKCIYGYYNVSVPSCDPCHFSCGTCLGPLDTDCQTCSHDTRVSLGGKCDCKPSYFENGGDPACTQCHYTCQDCAGNQSNQCKTCAGNRIPDPDVSSGFNKCICPNGLQAVEGQVNCAVCHYSCAKCIGPSSSECTVCADPGNRILTVLPPNTYGSCLCQQKYFDDSISPACQQCHQSCLTCRGTTSYQCLTCDITDNFRLDKAPFCPCDNYYTESPAGSYDKKCVACDLYCSQCDSNDITKCLACLDSENRVLNNNKCICKDGFYQVGTDRVCQPCPAICLTCQPNANPLLPPDCLSCRTEEFRALDGSNQCRCQPMYYKLNDTGSGQCQTCDAKCASCDPITGDCTTCIGGRENAPACTCTSPLIEYALTYPTCIGCHHSCKFNCFGNKPIDCLSPCDLNNNTGFNLNREFNPFLNSCSCKEGYSENGTDPVCMPCHYSCQTCSVTNDSTKCEICNPSNNRIALGTAPDISCPCKDGYYEKNGTDSYCDKCDFTCKTCQYDSLNPAKLPSQLCQTCETDNFRYLVGGSCPCKDGYYSESSNPICKQCHYSCQTCEVANRCKTCDSIQKRIYDPLTLQCKCQVGTYENFQNICKDCDLSCKTCSSSSPNRCTSCEDSYQRVFVTLNTIPLYGQCKCADGYYQEPNNKICKPCHYSCYTCTGPNDTDCAQCQMTRTKSVVTSKCECPSNQFDISGVAKCSSCPYYCLTCSNTQANRCVTCDAVKNRVMNTLTGICDCKEGFYDDGTATCQPCFSNCLACRGPNQYDCTKCQITANRLLNNGVCTCKDGYYNKTGQVNCEKCHKSCKTCLDNSTGSLTECTSCSLEQNRYQQGSSCLCLNGFYEDLVSLTCVACDRTCATCVNGIECQTCNASYFRTKSTITKLCECNVGYYQVGSELTCQQCDRTCKTCSAGSPNTCSSCDSSWNRVYKTNGSDITCECQDYYYDIPPNHVCDKCHYSCQQCSGPDRNQCNTCDPATFRNKVGSACVCQNKLFDILDNPVCQQCHYSCVDCTDNSASGCTSCPASRDLVNTQCLCKEGNIDDSVQQKCLPCHYSCATCSTASGTSSTCLTCNPLNFRTWSSNKCLCNIGYYDDGAQPKCQLCNPTCRECIGPSSSACKSCSADLFRILNASNQCICMDGYYESGGVCLKCNSNCRKCSGTDTFCTECQSLMKKVGNTCICDNGYYASGSDCLRCHISCSSCNGPTEGDCLTCDDYDQRECSQCTDSTQTNCVQCTLAEQAPTVKKYCRCKNRFFNQQGISQCYPCNYSCLTCNGINNCTSCDSVTDLRVVAGTQCQCQLGTYDAGSSVCQKCHYSCKGCQQDSRYDCLSCMEGQFRQFVLERNECACLNGFYDDGNQVCKQCHPSCFTCKGPLETDCLSCSATQHNRELNSVQGTCSCLLGYYNIPNQIRCQPCHYSCESCNSYGSNACQTCKQTDYRSFNSGRCDCVNGYYDDNKSPQCSSCHFSCKKCEGGLETQCTECDRSNSLREFNSSSRTCDCIEGYFSQVGVQQCQKCHFTCLACRGQNANQCTKCLASAKRFMQVDNTCACDAGYYEVASPENSNIKICVPCSSTCYTCQGFNQCTGCKQSDYRTLNSVTQQCECINGYYEVRTQSGVQNSCQACSAVDNRVVGRDKLSCVCKPGFFEDSITGKCTPCPISCAECSSLTKCTVCDSATFREFENYQCVPLLGFFDSGQAIAQKCSSECKSCVNILTNCTSCRTEDGYIMTDDKTSCRCKDDYQEVTDLDTGIKVCRSPQTLAQQNASKGNVMWFYIFLSISGILALIIVIYLARRICVKSSDPQRNPRVHAMDISEQDIFNQRPDETIQALDNDNSQNIPNIEQAQEYNFNRKKNRINLEKNGSADQNV